MLNVVLAGNYREFSNFVNHCRNTENLSTLHLSEPGDDYLFVADKTSLQGRTLNPFTTRVYELPSFHHRANALEIRNQILTLDIQENAIILIKLIN